jgi:hypothetical protein
MITAEEINSSVVRALTWRQPFGELMLHGKQETRTRQTHVRGLVLICVGLRPYEPEEAFKLTGGKQLERINEIFRDESISSWSHQLGQAIAVARLTDCMPMLATGNPENRLEEMRELENKTFVAYDPSKSIWRFDDVTTIVPFPFKGAQGWTTLTADQKDLIKFY